MAAQSVCTFPHQLRNNDIVVARHSNKQNCEADKLYERINQLYVILNTCGSPIHNFVPINYELQ